MPNAPTRPALRALRAGYLLLCNTILLALALEIGWRALAPLRHGGRGALERKVGGPDGVGYTLHPFFQVIYPPTRETDPGPDFAGWRIEPPDAASAPGRVRVLFLGGSTTQNAYPTFVRRELEPAVGPLTVYNLGFSWHTSLHSLYKLWTYADAIQPDLVIVLHAINDLCRGFTAPKHSLPQYRADYSHACGALNAFWTIGRSRHDGRPVFYAKPGPRYEQVFDPPDRSVAGLFAALQDASDLLRSLRRELGPTPDEPEHETVDMDDELVLRALPAFERNLANLRASCELKGIPVLFVTMPFSIETRVKTFLHPGDLTTNDGIHDLSEADFAMGMRRFNQAVRNLASEPGAFVVDVEPEITALEYFTDEVHMTDEGLELQAKLVAGAILERGLVRSR